MVIDTANYGSDQFGDDYPVRPFNMDYIVGKKVARKVGARAACMKLPPATAALGFGLKKRQINWVIF